MKVTIDGIYTFQNKNKNIILFVDKTQFIQSKEIPCFNFDIGDAIGIVSNVCPKVLPY